MSNSDYVTLALGVAKLPASLGRLALGLLRKQETLGTALQRLGWSSIERRSGPVIWFHVNGLEETTTALPVVHRCLQEYNEKVSVLLTTPCLNTYKQLIDSLPQRVVVQLVPECNPLTVSAFLRKWRPQVGVFLDAPFHRELSVLAQESGVSLALLNASLPGDEMLEWHTRNTSRRLVRQALSSFSLIVPRSDVDVGRFRIFGATLGQMPGWSTDLQQASELGACASRLMRQGPKLGRTLLKRLAKRQLWVVAHILQDEEAPVARVHAMLRHRHKGLLTVVAPAVQQTADGAAAMARRIAVEKSLRVELLSTVVKDVERLTSDVDVIVLDDAEALMAMYGLSEVVFVGGSLVPSLDGASSPAAAAVAGCALLMGPYGGQFLTMASDLNHAAAVASAEAAAAVAQTGATMRGIANGSMDTPRGPHGQAVGGNGGSPAGAVDAVLAVPQAAATAVAAVAASAAPRAGGAASGLRVDVEMCQNVMPGHLAGVSPTWQQLVLEVQRPVLSDRPMTAPATVPEDFQLRTFATSQPAGERNHLVLSHGRSSVTSPDTRGFAYSLGSATPASSVGSITPLPASAGFSTGASSRSRPSSLERFRWNAEKEVVGFGYQYKDGDGACSDDESGAEEGERQRDRAASRIVVDAGATDLVPEPDTDEGQPQHDQDSAAGDGAASRRSEDAAEQRPPPAVKSTPYEPACAVDLLRDLTACLPSGDAAPVSASADEAPAGTADEDLETESIGAECEFFDALEEETAAAVSPETVPAAAEAAAETVPAAAECNADEGVPLGCDNAVADACAAAAEPASQHLPDPCALPLPHQDFVPAPTEPTETECEAGSGVTESVKAALVLTTVAPTTATDNGAQKPSDSSDAKQLPALAHRSLYRIRDSLHHHPGAGAASAAGFSPFAAALGSLPEEHVAFFGLEETFSPTAPASAPASGGAAASSLLTRRFPSEAAVGGGRGRPLAVDTNLGMLFSAEGSPMSEDLGPENDSLQSKSSGERRSTPTSDSPQLPRASLEHYLQSMRAQALLAAGTPSRSRAASGALSRSMTRQPSNAAAVGSEETPADVALPGLAEAPAPVAECIETSDLVGSAAELHQVGSGESQDRPSLVDGLAADADHMDSLGTGTDDTPLMIIGGSALDSQQHGLETMGTFAEHCLESLIDMSVSAAVPRCGSKGSSDSAARRQSSGGQHDGPLAEFEFPPDTLPDDGESGSPTLVTNPSVQSGGIATGAVAGAVAGGSLSQGASEASQNAGNSGALAAGAQGSTGQAQTSSARSSANGVRADTAPPSGSQSRSQSPFSKSQYSWRVLDGASERGADSPATGSESSGGSKVKFSKWLYGNGPVPTVPESSAGSSPGAHDSSDDEAPPSRPSEEEIAALHAAIARASETTETRGRGSSRIGIYPVASIGSWLDEVGNLLPHPSEETQRRQAAQDPLKWFSVRMGSAGALEGVASGLRAPVPSPTAPEEQREGPSAEALASVRTVLFPPPPPGSDAAAASAAAGPVRQGGLVFGMAVLPRSGDSAAEADAAPAPALPRGPLSFANPPLPSVVAQGSGGTMPGFSALAAALAATESSPRGRASDVARTVTDSAVTPGRESTRSLDGRSSRAWPEELLPQALSVPRPPGTSPARAARQQVSLKDGRSPPSTSSDGRGPKSQSFRFPGTKANSVNGGVGRASASAMDALPMVVPAVSTPRRQLQRNQSAPSSIEALSMTQSFFSPSDGPALQPTGSTANVPRQRSASQVRDTPGSDDSSCPSTPTTRAATAASSPFRDPAGGMRGMQQPPAAAPFAWNAAASASFGAMLGAASAGLGRSLYAEEEAELEDGLGGAPLSPRASGFNTMFSPAASPGRPPAAHKRSSSASEDEGGDEFPDLPNLPNPQPGSSSRAVRITLSGGPLTVSAAGGARTPRSPGAAGTPDRRGGPRRADRALADVFNYEAAAAAGSPFARRDAGPGSPPRSPADRTTCPRGAQPTASPMKSQLPVSFSAPVPSNPAAFPMGLGAVPPSPRRARVSPPTSPSRSSTEQPLSPRAAYMSPCATDPRASPIKMPMTVGRTAPCTPMSPDASPRHRGSNMGGASSSASSMADVATALFTGAPGAGSSGLPSAVPPLSPARYGARVAAGPGFGGVVPVRTQGASSRPQTAASTPRRSGIPKPSRPPPSRHSHHHSASSNDDAPWPAPLAGRASAPVLGMIFPQDRTEPPTPRSNRGSATGMLPPPGNGMSFAMAEELHAKRSQQQHKHDATRVDSRVGSAAATPRSARALFGGASADGQQPRMPRPPSGSSSSSMGAAVEARASASPEFAPLSPRASATSGTSFFAYDAAGSAGDGSAAASQSRGGATGGTPRSARVLFPAATRASGTAAASSGSSTPAAAPSSGARASLGFPTSGWSPASRQSVGDQGMALPAASASSVDPLQAVLACMPPVSPNPKPSQAPSPRPSVTLSPRPSAAPSPVPASPRRVSTPAVGSAFAPVPLAAPVSSDGGRRPGSRAASSPLLQAALLQQAIRLSGSIPGAASSSSSSVPQFGGCYVPSTAFPGASPGSSAAVSHAAVTQPPLSPRAAAPKSLYDTISPVAPAEPPRSPRAAGLPPLPPFPQLPPLPQALTGQAAPLSPRSPATSGAAPSAWGVSFTPRAHASTSTTFGGQATSPTEPVAAEGQSVRRRLFRKSAPQLSLAGAARGAAAAAVVGAPLPETCSVPLPGMPTPAEQAMASMDLDAQFAPVEAMAAELDNETRLVTPTAVMAGDTNLFRASAGPDFFAAAPILGQRPSTAPDMGPAPAQVPPPLGAGSRRPSGHPSDLPHGAAVSAAAGNAGGAGVPVGGKAGFGAGPADAKGAAFAGDSGSMQCQEPSQLSSDASNATRPRPAVAAPAAGPAGAAQARGQPAARFGDNASPVGSIGSAAHQPGVPPIARYANQYLIPASQLPNGPRVGPAVWVVSGEDELAAALSTLLRDPLERRSRGRAAAQGAAKLASSLVSTVWNVLEDMVISPALQKYVAASEASAQ